MPVLGGSTPLTSVNGHSGTSVTLSPADIGAAPATGNYGPLGIDVPVIGLHEDNPTASIQALLRRGFTPIWASELAAARAGKQGLPPQPALLIYDDGASDWYNTIHPVITSYGVKATMAVTSNYLYQGPAGAVDLPKPSITWDQARTMHATGFYEWQNHTTTHASSPSTYEMDTCNQAIVTELGVPKPCAIIYPHGIWGADTLQRARALGFTIGFGYGSGQQRPAHISGNSEVLTIDRIEDTTTPLKWVEQTVLYAAENDCAGARNDGNKLNYWNLPAFTSLGQNGKSIVLDSTSTAGAITLTNNDLFAVRPGRLIHVYAAGASTTGATTGTGTIQILQFDSSGAALSPLTIATVPSGGSGGRIDVEAALSSTCRWVQIQLSADAPFNGKFEVTNLSVRMV